MSDNSMKTRERAESAFAKAQTQFMARRRITSEIDAVAAAQAEKTNRLRALRLEKEARELAAGPVPAKAKPRSRAGLPADHCLRHHGKVEPFPV